MNKLSLLSRILLATGMMVAGTLSVAPQNKSESGGVLTLHLKAVCQGLYNRQQSYHATGGIEEKGTEVEADSIAWTVEGTSKWEYVIDENGGVTQKPLSADYRVEAAGGGKKSGNSVRYGSCGSEGGPVPRELKSTESATWSYHVKDPANVHGRPAISFSSEAGMYAIDLPSYNLFENWPENLEVQEQGSKTIEYCSNAETTNEVHALAESAAPAACFAAGVAMYDDEGFKERLKGQFTPHSKAVRLSGAASYSDQPEVTDTGEGEKTRSSAKIDVTYLLDFTREPEEVEAAIIPPSDYSKWLPEAGEDEKDPGNTIGVTARIHKKGQPGKSPTNKARFKFELVGTSKEKGVCVNKPSYRETKDKPADFDLRIRPEDNNGFDVSADGQTATSKKFSADAEIVLTSFDYGAWTRLKVTALMEDGNSFTAHLEGNNGKKELVVPRDDNNNHVADAWEKDMGVFQQNLRPDWAEAENPIEQRANGDGISLFEKYRGFEFEQDVERLDPSWKYVFVFDPDLLVQSIPEDPVTAGVAFEKLTNLRLRYVDEDHWTGRGTFTEGKRIVNFNGKYGNATRQHALHVENDRESEGLVMPQDFIDMMANAGLRVAGPGMFFLGFDGIALPDADNSPAGPPISTYRIVVYSFHIAWFAIYDGLNFFGHQLWDSRKAGEDGNSPEFKAREMTMLGDYMRAHPDELWQRIAKFTATVTSHEMMHGVGVRHHAPDKYKGNDRCVIRYFEDDLRGRPDPFGLKGPWPDVLCSRLNTTISKRYAPETQTCWPWVLVSDAKRGK
jgi:hypothetical protein